MALEELRCALPPLPEAPGDARRLARDQLKAWSADGAVDDVLLLLSEVVTNAIHHARSEVEMVLARRGDMVRVEIRDASPALPVQEAMSHDALRGRGMGIVAAVASRWGVDSIPDDGKTVWFEVGV